MVIKILICVAQSLVLGYHLGGDAFKKKIRVRTQSSNVYVKDLQHLLGFG